MIRKLLLSNEGTSVLLPKDLTINRLNRLIQAKQQIFAFKETNFIVSMFKVRRGQEKGIIIVDLHLHQTDFDEDVRHH